MANAKKIEVTSNRETNKWRTLLLKRKNEILIDENEVKTQALEGLSPQGTGEISQHRLHPGDLATDMQQAEMLDTLSAKNIEKMRRIEEAIERLERGEYGLCQNCGERIPVERLEAIPEASYCLSCASELEETRSRSARSNISNEASEASRAKSFDDLRVSDIMHENPIAVSEEESLAVVIELMTENKIRHLPVINEDGDIQGIISDRDLLDLALRSPYQLDSFINSKRVADIMTRSPEVIGPDTLLSEAGNYLLDQKISCLPVVEGDRLVGIVTESDFVKLVS